ncbi:sugar phosphate isomerase/epimerase family protein [Paenibacillus sp. GCM10023252]|uniref:sugar phosphate isomerase/epimerase family protein n=1 Tax=Paenibacillus sp. GCM10023252 TaxID=3252649 RepID=UPI00360BC7CD
MISQAELDVQMSWWAMSGLGKEGREWTIEERFEKLAEAGFSGILAPMPQAGYDAVKWCRLLDHYRFSYGVQLVPFPKEGDDLTDQLRLAKSLGACYVNAQVMGAYLPAERACRMIISYIEQAGAADIPIYFETHRGRVTQDLLRTTALVEAVPALRLTQDLSHYAAASAMEKEGCEVSEPLLRQLLARTSCIHARVSNGHQIQIDIGGQGDHPMVQLYAEWWAYGMRAWLKEQRRKHSREAGCGPAPLAAPDTSTLKGDRFPFVCELGPAPYAITCTDGREISDRWQQSLVLKEIGERLWNRIAREDY